MLNVWKIYFKEKFIGDFLTFSKDEALKVGKEVFLTLNKNIDKNTLKPADFTAKKFC